MLPSQVADISQDQNTDQPKNIAPNPNIAIRDDHVVYQESTIGSSHHDLQNEQDDNVGLPQEDLTSRKTARFDNVNNRFGNSIRQSTGDDLLCRTSTTQRCHDDSVRYNRLNQPNDNVGLPQEDLTSRKTARFDNVNNRFGNSTRQSTGDDLLCRTSTTQRCHDDSIRYNRLNQPNDNVGLRQETFTSCKIPRFDSVRDALKYLAGDEINTDATRNFPGGSYHENVSNEESEQVRDDIYRYEYKDDSLNTLVHVEKGKVFTYRQIGAITQFLLTQQVEKKIINNIVLATVAEHKHTCERCKHEADQGDCRMRVGSTIVEHNKMFFHVG